MSQDAVSHLVQEMRDLLDVGPVGLYEFMWQLNATGGSTTHDERRATARRALDQLLAEPGVALYWMTWADASATRDASIDEVGPDAWNDIPASGQYLAIDRPA